MRVFLSGLLVALATLAGAAFTPVSAAAPGAVAGKAIAAAPAAENVHWRHRRHRWRGFYGGPYVRLYIGPRYYWRPRRYYYSGYDYYPRHYYYPRYHRRHWRRHHRWRRHW